MRFTILLFFIALMPVMMLAHWWDFEENGQPALRREVEKILADAGIEGATADLRYLDLSVGGAAPDEAAVQKVVGDLSALRGLRLASNRIFIPARIRARLDQNRLLLDGWMPDSGAVASLAAVFKGMRPDLTIHAEAMATSPLVRLPEGESLPLTESSPMLLPVIEALQIPSRLSIRRDKDRLVLEGMLPSANLRDAVIDAVRSGPHRLTVMADQLRTSRHALAAPFTAESVLPDFLRSFYGTSAPGAFSIHASENPRLSADATLSLESTWLGLLRPLTRGRRADLTLTYHPSALHFPGRRPETSLSPEMLQDVQAQVSGQYFTFPAGSSSLSSAEQARLASIVPALLMAGPALRLVVGGHPDPAGDLQSERSLARRRAEQVVSFLIEQGTPSSDIKAVAFDPVPAGGKHAPAQPSSVEILIQ
jgi:hypothetical protein